MKDLKYIQSVWDSTIGISDINYDANGDIICVENEDRLRQDIVKILITESGVLPYPNYGTILPLIPNNVRYSQEILDTIATSIIASLRYMTLGDSTANPRERISAVDNLDVTYQDAAVACNLKTTTQAKTTVESTILI